MYVPHANAVDPAEVASFVRAIGSADLVTVVDATPVSTLHEEPRRG